MLMRLTVWKLDNESKLNDLIDFDDAELADDTDDTPVDSKTGLNWFES